MPTIGDWFEGLWPGRNPYVCLCGAYREDTCECGQWREYREEKEARVAKARVARRGVFHGSRGRKS